MDPLKAAAATFVCLALFWLAFRLTRRLVELGRTARAESGVKIRQPLSRSLASGPGFATLGPELIAEIASVANLDAILEGFGQASGRRSVS